jgi:hypothetical protein
MVAPCAAFNCNTSLWLKEPYVPAARPRPMSSTKMRAGTELLIDLAPGILKNLCKSETFTKAQAIPWTLTFD